MICSRFGFDKMDKKILVAIVVALLLNVTVILVGFGYLQNEINQLKNENLTESKTPTSTEASSTETSEQPKNPEYPKTSQEPEAPQTPEEPPEQDINKSENQVNNPQADNTNLQNETEPPKITKHKLIAPEAHFTVKCLDYDEFEATGNIMNPNPVPVYNVSIELNFNGVIWYSMIPMHDGGTVGSVSIGHMEGNEVIHFSEIVDFGFLRSAHLEGDYAGSYKVRWDELE